MKNLYLENGYFNVRAVVEYNCPFNFVIGGRGTGKTYGVLNYCLEEKLKFCFMRRTKTAFDDAVVLNPMDAISRDRNFLYTCHHLEGSKNIYGWYYGTLDDNGEVIDADKDYLGIGGPLVKIGKTRGLTTTNISVMINDEFVRAPYEQKIKNEVDAFYNAYETVNRNREFEGKKPLIAFLLSNSDDMTNDYFIDRNLVDIVDKMKTKNENFYVNREDGYTISILSDSPISEKKNETALYKFTRGSRFQKMATGNEFVNNEHTVPKSMPLIEFRALVRIGELVVYKHKSADMYYCSLHLSGNCETFSGTSDIDKKRFCARYFYLWEAYIDEKIIFETYTTEMLFNKYFD